MYICMYMFVYIYIDRHVKESTYIIQNVSSYRGVAKYIYIFQFIIFQYILCGTSPKFTKNLLKH